MKTQIILQNDPDTRRCVLDAIRNGKVVALPTDTVYGIACAVDNPRAIAQMYSIKERDALKAIPVLIGDFNQLAHIAAEFNSKAKLIIEHFWPGALTVVVSKNPALPQELTMYPTVGIRMPDYGWLLDLMRACGPLAATSANLSGAASPTSAQEVLAQLEGRIDLIVDGGTCAGGIPSTVIDCSREPVEILREGGISSASIFELINKQSSNGEK
ncbi:MAG: threonylcarbamoyl-AMP synthase [Anaerolineae bacterium]|jgi:L-threonylcarbamoyladenylate synthase|nr:threonylcarbamoyl-AMP synthase [Anaerolineae bacterium]